MESDVREKILETARCIFLKEGYKGTTINSIARAAGISPSTIYLHFNGKKDLFENLDISEEGQRGALLRCHAGDTVLFQFFEHSAGNRRL